MLTQKSLAFSRWAQQRVVLFFTLVALVPLLLQVIWGTFGLYEDFGFLAPLYALVGYSSWTAALCFFALCLRFPLEAEQKLSHWFDIYSTNNKPLRLASVVLAMSVWGGFYLFSMFWNPLIGSIFSYPFHVRDERIQSLLFGCFFLVAFEVVYALRMRPTRDASRSLLMVVSGYYLVVALLDFGSITSMVLCFLSAGAAFISMRGLGDQVSFLLRLTAQSDPGYQVAPYHRADFEGTPYLVYYPTAVYDGMVFRVEGDPSEPFLSQPRQIPFALLPLDPNTLFPHLYTSMKYSFLLLIVSLVGAFSSLAFWQTS